MASIKSVVAEEAMAVSTGTDTRRAAAAAAGGGRVASGGGGRVASGGGGRVASGGGGRVASGGGGGGRVAVHSQVVRIKKEDEDLKEGLTLSHRERVVVFNFSSEMKDVFNAGRSGRQAFRSRLGLQTAEQALGACGIRANQ